MIISGTRDGTPLDRPPQLCHGPSGDNRTVALKRTALHKLPEKLHNARPRERTHLPRTDLFDESRDREKRGLRPKTATSCFQRCDERVDGRLGARSLEAAFDGSILGAARAESTVPPIEPKHQNPCFFFLSVTWTHDIYMRVSLFLPLSLFLFSFYFAAIAITNSNLKSVAIDKTFIRNESDTGMMPLYLYQAFYRPARLYGRIYAVMQI